MQLSCNYYATSEQVLLKTIRAVCITPSKCASNRTNHREISRRDMKYAPEPHESKHISLAQYDLSMDSQYAVSSLLACRGSLGPETPWSRAVWSTP